MSCTCRRWTSGAEFLELGAADPLPTLARRTTYLRMQDHFTDEPCDQTDPAECCRPNQPGIRPRILEQFDADDGGNRRDRKGCAKKQQAPTERIPPSPRPGLEEFSGSVGTDQETEGFAFPSGADLGVAIRMDTHIGAQVRIAKTQGRLALSCRQPARRAPKPPNDRHYTYRDPLSAVCRYRPRSLAPLEQASYNGELAHAVDAGALDRGDVIQLGDVLAGISPGRESDRDITVFDSTGLAIQDLAVALAAMERADELHLPTLEL